LVLNKDSHFLSMILETGNANSKKLINLALGKDENEDFNLNNKIIQSENIVDNVELNSSNNFEDN